MISMEKWMYVLTEVASLYQWTLLDYQVRGEPNVNIQDKSWAAPSVANGDHTPGIDGNYRVIILFLLW